MDEILHKLFTIRNLDLTFERVMFATEAVAKRNPEKKLALIEQNLNPLQKRCSALTSNLQDNWELVIWLLNS